MKFFVDNRMFGNSMSGGAVPMARQQAAPTPASAPVQAALPPAPRKPRFLGQAGTSINDLVDRIKSDVSVLSGYYGRNASLPLEYRVSGAVYARVADYSDAIWKDMVVPHDASPDSSAWNAPASQSALSRVALSEQMIADFGQQVSAAEAKYAQAQGSQASTPPSVTQATVQPQGQGFQWSLGTAALGLLAIATIAGVLFFTPAAPIEGKVSELPKA